MTLIDLIKNANALRRKHGTTGEEFEVVISDPDTGAELEVETLFASPSRSKVMIVAGSALQLKLEPGIEEMRKLKEPAK